MEPTTRERAGRDDARSGFTLLEIVIAVAIVAVMAGAVAPLAYRQIEAGRRDATVAEMDALRGGLLAFYDDVGRMPTAGEGLAALATDPGLGNWQGPYLAGELADPGADLGQDAWHTDYVYDPAPTTNPGGAANALIASGGSDHQVTLGRVGRTWNINGTADDLLALVVTAPTDRAKTRACREEMEVLAAAGRAYFRDHAAFPVATADLSGTYLDAGSGGAAFVDPWLVAYELTIDTTGANPPDWIVRSFGPDRVDENGAGDDLTVIVSSVPPATETTRYKLDIAQQVLNQAASLALTGVWPGSDRSALGLAATFDSDGWGRGFLVNVSSRTIYSAGPDGNGATTTDNIPVGMGP